MTKQAYLAEKEIEFDTSLKNNQYDDYIPTTSIYEMYTCCWFVVNKFKGLKDIKFYSKAEKYFSQDIKWCTLFKLVKENCMKCFK